MDVLAGLPYCLYRSAESANDKSSRSATGQPSNGCSFFSCASLISACSRATAVGNVCAPPSALDNLAPGQQMVKSLVASAFVDQLFADVLSPLSRSQRRPNIAEWQPARGLRLHHMKVFNRCRHADERLNGSEKQASRTTTKVAPRQDHDHYKGRLGGC
ncbi:hypothetical protein M514_18112 [Trichuris suis]|uniref:Uncharacterized protein n=1 Tax=Trichuris suis TaxID=68888 RepID=A0A085NJT1_9BILA|nr:hypothetical protein M514_18112 [Trichuris suis]